MQFCLLIGSVAVGQPSVDVASSTSETVCRNAHLFPFLQFLYLFIRNATVISAYFAQLSIFGNLAFYLNQNPDRQLFRLTVAFLEES